jgi:hypothetical protein
MTNKKTEKLKEKKEETIQQQQQPPTNEDISSEDFIKQMLGECDKKKTLFMDFKIQHQMDDSCFSTLNLEILKKKIEKMTKVYHIEILKILKEDSTIKLNENKSGVFINLSFLPKETIIKLYNYVDYVEKQESSILNLETEIDKYKKMI